MSATAEPIRASEMTGAWPQSDEQRLLLDGIDWSGYEAFGEILRDRPGIRITYDRGALQIVTTSPAHEIYKKRLGRLLETLAEEAGLAIEPAGSMTFKRQDLERGLEPDECFWIAREPEMRGKLTWNAASDPPPDLVVEIEVSRSALDRLGIYASLGVPEVWCYDGSSLRVLVLETSGDYEVSEASPAFPGFPVAEIAQFLTPDPSLDYLSMVRTFRAWVVQQMRTAGEAVPVSESRAGSGEEQ
jgi:Uma2 family endonuclease